MTCELSPELSTWEILCLLRILVLDPGGCQERLLEELDQSSFRVRLGDGRLRHCHLDQLRRRVVEEDDSDTSEDTGSAPGSSPVTGGEIAGPPIAVPDGLDATPPSGTVYPNEQSNAQPNVEPTDRSTNQQMPRYPRRNRKE